MSIAVASSGWPAASPSSSSGSEPQARSVAMAESLQSVQGRGDVCNANQGSTRRNDWPERDLAIVFTALLGGLRADELISANIGDIRRTDDGGVRHVHGKADKDRRIPFARELLDVLEQYLQSCTSCFPQARTRSPGASEMAEDAWAAGATVHEIGCDLARLADGRAAGQKAKDL
jgi:hypothetical protein